MTTNKDNPGAQSATPAGDPAPQGGDPAPDTPPTDTSAQPAADGGDGKPTGDQGPGEGTKPGSLLGDAPASSQTTDDGNGVELELTLPEGVELEQEMLDSFKQKFGTLAAEHKLDGAVASATATGVVEWYAEEITKASERAAQQLEKERTQRANDWLKDCKADADFGGQKFEQSHAHAKQFMQRFAPGLGAVLDEYHIGNHPVIFKALARAGAAIAEDTTRAPKAPPVQKPKTRADRYRKRHDHPDSQRNHRSG